MNFKISVFFLLATLNVYSKYPSQVVSEFVHNFRIHSNLNQEQHKPNYTDIAKKYISTYLNSTNIDELVNETQEETKIKQELLDRTLKNLESFESYDLLRIVDLKELTKYAKQKINIIVDRAFLEPGS